MVAIILGVVAGVVSRLFGHAIFGIHDFVSAGMAVVASFAVVYAALSGAHVTVNILVSRLPPRVQAIAQSVNSALGIGFWSVACWTGAMFAWKMWTRFDERSLSVGIFIPPFRYVWVFCLVLLCLILLVALFRALSGVVRK
jgi:TRAP-type C4-dicarboxylate transport system permease small subunit